MRKYAISLSILSICLALIQSSCDRDNGSKQLADTGNRIAEKTEQEIERTRIENALISQYSPIFFPPKEYSEIKVFTYNLQRYLLRGSKPVLFKGFLNDITDEDGQIIVHISTSLFYDDSFDLYPHSFDERRINFHLKSKSETVQYLLRNPPKEELGVVTESRGFYVICSIENVSKAIRYVTRGYGHDDSEDVNLEIRSPDTFNAFGELIRLVKYK